MTSAHGNSLGSRIRRSFRADVGDIGMEDRTVSIFRLVFGVALSTNDSEVVLLAGATGAIAAAVSMMAGANLDAEPVRDQAQAQKQSSAAQREEGVSTAAALADILARAGVAPVANVRKVTAEHPGLARGIRSPRTGGLNPFFIRSVIRSARGRNASRAMALQPWLTRKHGIAGAVSTAGMTVVPEAGKL